VRTSTEPRSAVQDFDFYMGSWRIHHRRLKERLAGKDEWEEFEGTSVAWPLLGGAGNGRWDHVGGQLDHGVHPDRLISSVIRGLFLPD